MSKFFKIAAWLFSLLLVGGNAALAVTLEFVPSAQTVSLGDQATVDVEVTGLSNQLVGAYDFFVNWDPTILSFASIAGDKYLDGPANSILNFSSVPGTPGAEEVNETSLGSLANQTGNGSFRLFSLTFNTLAVGTSPLSFTGHIAPDNRFLGDENGDLITPVDTQNGSITVQGGGPSPMPEPGILMLMGIGLAGMAARRIACRGMD